MTNPKAGGAAAEQALILRQIQELGAAAGIVTSGAETNQSNGSRKSSRSSNCSSSRKSSAAVMSENGRRGAHPVRKVSFIPFALDSKLYKFQGGLKRPKTCHKIDYVHRKVAP